MILLRIHLLHLRVNFTAEVVVVESDTLHELNKNTFFPNVIYKLKVERVFGNSLMVDFIWMENVIGTGCQRGIRQDSIGQKYMVTGKLFDSEDYKPWLKGEDQRTFLHATTCGKTVLEVDGNNVFGEISINNSAEIKNKYNELMKGDELKVKAYYDAVYKTRRHPDRIQKMSLSEFYKLLGE